MSSIRIPAVRTAGGVLLALLVISGCQSPSPRRVVVFAAASLTKTFTALSGAFTDAKSDAAVELSFAGSADLLTQLTQGADADVFAAADTATMNKAVRAGLIDGSPRSFATNTLTIVVQPGNPKAVRSFRDLTRVSTVTCATQVPCGAALAGLQSRTGVRLDPASEESSVTDVLNKVTGGAADAGLVYRTDARAAGEKVTEVAFPEAASAVNTYQIAVLKDSRDPVLARRFVDLITGAAGRQVMATAGFGAP
jgi:molybdate transport system substrate-binding protein